jgi:hypothetical protein
VHKVQNVVSQTAVCSKTLLEPVNIYRAIVPRLYIEGKGNDCPVQPAKLIWCSRV